MWDIRQRCFDHRQQLLCQHVSTKQQQQRSITRHFRSAIHYMSRYKNCIIGLTVESEFWPLILGSAGINREEFGRKFLLGTRISVLDTFKRQKRYLALVEVWFLTASLIPDRCQILRRLSGHGRSDIRSASEPDRLNWLRNHPSSGVNRQLKVSFLLLWL